MPRSPRWWTPRRDVELILDDDDEVEGTTDALGDDERTFIPLSGGSWERRLSRREKTMRGAASVSVALVVVIILLGGPGTVLAYLANVAQTFSPAPVAQAAAPGVSNALDVPVPANIAENPLVTVEPVNGQNTMAYGCWVDEAAGDVGTASAPLRLALYTLATHNWTSLPTPATQAAGCEIVTNMTSPDAVILALAKPVTQGEPCQLPDLYRSEDRGVHWVSLPWPTGALAACTLRFYWEGTRLYLQSNTRLLPGSAASGSAGLLLVTSDDGATWAAADAGIAGLSNVAVVAMRPGGRLLAQGNDPQRNGVTTLWQSDDAGANWSFVTTIPGANSRVYASSDPSATDHGGWGRLYVYSNSSSAAQGALPVTANGATQAGAALWTGFTEPQWSLNNLQPNGAAIPTWSGVSLTPRSASLGGRPAGSWLRDASEGANGSMIFTQPQATDNINTITSPNTLFVWNQREWITLPQVIPSNGIVQGVSWDSGVMRLWITHKASVLRPVQLLLFTISASDLA